VSRKPHPLTDHPYADIFPMMSEEEYITLRADIEANGLREAIWLYEGQILDGRNRYRACVDVGVDVRTEAYLGDDPLAFVVSLNLARRHLNPGQLAAVSLKIEKFEAERAARRQRDAGAAQGDRGKEGGRGKKKPLEANLPQGVSKRQLQAREKAAKATGASARNVQYYKKLAAEAPALAEEVLKGTRTLHAAMRQHTENQRKAELTTTPPADLPAGLFVGDFRELSKDIADDSVSLIFTDPPYDTKSIPLFEQLAEVAARVLKPGGSVIAYCGQTQLPAVLAGMSKHLRYW
jgi:16S rRNA G966 N2-methylase RsmD